MFGLLFTTASPTFATPTPTPCDLGEPDNPCDIATMTAYALTSAPSPTTTPEFLGVFKTSTPAGTVGVDHTCPDTFFDTANLDPQWAMVCSACVEAERGTLTPPYGVPLPKFPTSVGFPTLDLSTFTPVPTASPFVTPSLVPTATITPTASATSLPTWCVDLDFSDGNAYFSPSPGAYWNAGTQPHWDGSAWVAGVVHASGVSSENWNTLLIARLMPAMHLTRVRMYTDVTIGTNVPSFPNTFAFAPSGDYALGYFLASTTTSMSGVLEWTGDTSFSEQNWIFGGGLSYRNDSSSPNGSGRITRIRFEGIGSTNPFAGSFAPGEDNDGIVPCSGDPTPTPTVAPTSTGTVTAVSTPTASPQWWATGFHLDNGISVSCQEPEYIDMDKNLIDIGFEPSAHDPTCLRVVPEIDFSPDPIFGITLPSIVLVPVDVCFWGISLAINILGFQVDMSILVGVPIIAFLLRWVMFQ